MKTASVAVFGWLVPGGAYLPSRRYLRFALCLALVTSACCAGVALRGADLWPQAAELQGIDGLTALLAEAGAATTALAGGPYLLARLFGYSETFTGGRVHEYGTTLMLLAGLFNLLMLADGLKRRKEENK
jgi:hypothetical protein